MTDARTSRPDTYLASRPGLARRASFVRSIFRARPHARIWVLVIGVGGLVALVSLLAVPPLNRPVTPTPTSSGTAPPAPFRPSFAQPDGLITNEFAHFNPTNPDILTSPDWDVSSGSLFAHGGNGWSGKPDDRKPDATSSTGTDSSVFRMTTQRQDFRDVTVSLQVRNNGLTSTNRTPPSDIDGIHVFLRYQNSAELYVVSLNRRDNTLVIKKKVPGGDEEGGHYAQLGMVSNEVPYGLWQTWSVGITNRPDGTVVLSVYQQGHLKLAVGDAGSGGPVIAGAGAVGLRADNCDFEFRDFRVDPA